MKKKENISDEQRSGRPRITEAATDETIINEAKQTIFTSPKQIKRKLELNDISRSSFNRSRFTRSCSST